MFKNWDGSLKWTPIILIIAAIFSLIKQETTWFILSLLALGWYLDSSDLHRKNDLQGVRVGFSIQFKYFDSLPFFSEKILPMLKNVVTKEEVEELMPRTYSAHEKKSAQALELISYEKIFRREIIRSLEKCGETRHMKFLLFNFYNENSDSRYYWSELDKTFSDTLRFDLRFFDGQSYYDNDKKNKFWHGIFGLHGKIDWKQIDKKDYKIFTIYLQIHDDSHLKDGQKSVVLYEFPLDLLSEKVRSNKKTFDQLIKIFSLKLSNSVSFGNEYIDVHLELPSNMWYLPRN